MTSSLFNSSDLTDAEIKDQWPSDIVQITMLQLSAIGKIEAAKEYIDEIIESDQKIVVFCKHAVVDFT
jgi:SWI/SNF-related matrix-associated actin-dependent regulator 1 of chromatin subfamily A